MRVFPILLVLSTMILPATAFGVIETIEIVPANPTISDSVSVGIGGFVPDSCWDPPHRTECRLVGEKLLLVDIYVRDRWEPGMVCLLIISPYEAVCRFGKLEAGDYLVVVTEHRESLRFSSPLTESLKFRVDDPTPVRGTTWGTIKAIYRTSPD